MQNNFLNGKKKHTRNSPRASKMVENGSDQAVVVSKETELTWLLH